MFHNETLAEFMAYKRHEAKQIPDEETMFQ